MIASIIYCGRSGKSVVAFRTVPTNWWAFLLLLIKAEYYVSNIVCAKLKKKYLKRKLDSTNLSVDNIQLLVESI